jgi:hypothetical protein
MSLLSCLYRPPWKAIIYTFISWMLQEGLAPVVVSVLWLLVAAPLLLGCLATPLQSAEATHRKHKTKHRPLSRKAPPWADELTWSHSNPLTNMQKPKRQTLEDSVEQAVTSVANYLRAMSVALLDAGCSSLDIAWSKYQSFIFGIRTRRTRSHTGRLSRKKSSATYYIRGASKHNSRSRGVLRCSRVARKRASARHRWVRLACLAATTVTPGARGTAAAFAANLPQLLRTQRRFAAFDSDSVTLRVDNCCTACFHHEQPGRRGGHSNTYQGPHRGLHRWRSSRHCQVYPEVASRGR